LKIKTPFDIIEMRLPTAKQNQKEDIQNE